MNPTRRHLLQGMALLPLLNLWQPDVQASTLPAMTLPTTTLTVHSAQGPHRLTVELASSTAERNQGLMERDTLAEDAGMLFLYDAVQPAANGFWMYRTRIALDVAFLDAEGRINDIRHMQPCRSASPSDCPVTRPSQPYHAALEVNAGYFEAKGIEVGDCVSWPERSGGTCRQE
ncbi:DUF192 domain-containing protein [Halomonas elongata]|uniref:Uncharacterized protein n=1 Tax=Halomonas elongata TaxID=2746 RepID=A0A1B8P612_HALEL|nr:DUF192 domain-containing protein [Halomonas elongata]MBW5801312.1 DUF192 domain-containing protein [Halomonas elongata]OBX37704.1 hypothetical protein A8U91_02082 [Halomonas elongata]RAW06298.1 DUF192 domain-containing protein [Halomonas elongata]